MLRITGNVLITALLLILFSCGEDEVETTELETLTGEWRTTALTSEIEFTIFLLGTESTSNLDINGTNFDHDVIFTQNNITFSGTYTLESTTLKDGVPVEVETGEIDDFNGSASYELDGDELILNGSLFNYGIIDGDDVDQNEPQSFTVKFNNNEEIVIRQYREIETNDPESPISSESKVTITTTLKRK